MRQSRVVPKTANKREMKIRVPVKSGLARFLLGPVGRALVVGCALCTILGLGVFTYYYAKYARIIDQKLKAGPFANNAKIYAVPESVALGDATSPAEVAAELRHSGYNESRGNPVGYYLLQTNAIEIFPGPDSYFEQEAGVIKFAGGKISAIVSLQDNTPRTEYQLEPQLITNISGASREKRRMVKFADIPQVLVQALTSAEDKRFFQHAGIDPIGIVRAAYVDLKEHRKDQGASTLSMQLAREFFLDREKKLTRKLAEAIITLQLEQKLSKEQIFEDYCNQIYLGSRGTFRIHGFGEAAEVFLGKDLSQINLPEAAELASLPRWPAYFDPFRHPDHLTERRNAVLGLMRQNGYISQHDYELAVQAPLTVAAKGTAQSAEAPYFVDLVNDTLQSKFQDTDFQNNAFRIYTTLDMRLQQAAAEAIRNGMANVDQQLRRQRRFRGQKLPEAQVALVAIDPHTGEVKALAGGRNYGASQLNHVLAKRQPGSVFKPFVYAAALDTALEGGPRILTASTMVNDEPTTFWFDGKPYEPSNFEHEFYGNVTLRQALAHSLNVATVKVAEAVGFDSVVAMARRAGITDIQPTPSVALGAYDVTPLEAAGAYTMFANQGAYVKPSFIRLVRSQDGKVLFKHREQPKQVLDPRIAYLVTNLMEEVLRSGTAAGVRERYGFNAPAAGKTGTSQKERDGWFAGYTTELECVVWVGFDDSRDLGLEGAHSAAPIWAEFMKRAVQLREYRDAQPFQAPDGIVSVEIDPQSGMLATPSCPETRSEVYVAGTQPVSACPLHGGGRVTNVAGWQTQPPAQAGPAGTSAAAPGATAPRITGTGGDGVVSPSAVSRRAARQNPDAAQVQPQPAETPKKEEKKSIFRKIWGVFK